MLTFRSESGIVLKLDQHAVEQMQCHAQRESGMPEAGGILLGRWLLNPSHYIVDEVSEPGPEDRQTRVSFFRSMQAHQQQILTSLRRSRRTCGYLGEWHTHPEPIPHPSTTDLDDWRRHLVVDQVDIPEVFFVIVGTASTCAWMAHRTRPRRQIIKLELVPTNYCGSRN